MKQGAKYAGGALLAAALLWFVLHDVDRTELWASLQNASIAGLVLCGVINLAHNAFRAWRWGDLLKPVRTPIPFRSRCSAIVIGYLTTWTVPGRLGELVRPTLLSARERIPLGPCIGSVLADRILDGVAIVALFVVGTRLAPPSAAGGGSYAAHIGQIAWVLFAVLLVLLVFLIVAGSLSERVRPWVERRSGAVRFTARAALSLVSGAEALRTPRLLAPILGHSLMAWLTIAFGTWIGIRACGANIPFGAVLVLLPQLALGVALPTPGGAGGYHVAMKVGLQQLYGVPEAVAVSTGILVHLTVTVPVIVAGVAMLRADGVTFHDLTAMARDAIRNNRADAPVPAKAPVEAA